MKDILLLSFTIKGRFYIFTLLFFIKGIWIHNTQKKQKPILEVLNDTSEEWIEEGESKLSPKPAQADAMANKLKAGLSQIPEKYRSYFIFGVLAFAFFFLFGIVNFIYWSVIVIMAYNTIGWVLLNITCGYVFFKAGKGMYKYFKEKKYYSYIIIIKIIWGQAVIKSLERYSLINND